MKTLIAIPSRMASTRLPGKPLADIGGLPMIVRVYQQALKANLGEVVVAAGDAEIVDAVIAHGGTAVLTDPALSNGTDRIWAATQTLMAQGMEKPDIIINVQGDEPFLPPELLTQCLAAFTQYPQADVVTFAHPITEEDDKADVSKVKIAMTPSGRALYFSRCPIPYGSENLVRHIGFYGYRYAALETYVSAAPGTLELTEKLEQLRGLELDLHYQVEITHHQPIGIDTPEHLEQARKLVA